jgi:hypothetical protein
VMSVVQMFNDPAIHHRLPPEKLEFHSDYLSGGLWIGGMLLLGALLIRVSYREAHTSPIRVPIPKSKKNRTST